MASASRYRAANGAYCCRCASVWRITDRAFPTAWSTACLILSCQVGVRKPSPTLYDTCLQRFAEKGIQPGEILYVGNRLQSDLAVAKQLGIKTALYVGDKLSLKANSTEINNKNLRPKRLLTDLKQISNIVGQ